MWRAVYNVGGGLGEQSGARGMKVAFAGGRVMGALRRSLPPLPTLLLGAVVIAGAVAGELYVGASERHDEVSCTNAGSAVQLPDLAEASGLAVSRRTPGILWSFNDSGEPLVYALDPQGTVRGKVRVAGAAVKNWEAIAAARCPRGNCLYIADIGDNGEKRPQIVVYRVPEPHPSDQATAMAERLTAEYADGPHDAEALFVSRESTIYVVTKDKPALVYRFPERLQTGTTMRLERVTALPMEKVTDADTSPDGEWIGVRSKEEVIFFRDEEFALGEHGTPVNLRPFGEAQGEGIALAEGGRVYLASEGKKKGPGTLRELQCRFPARPS
jgi:hypothetical protein